MDSLVVDITLPRRTFDLRLALTLGRETVALIGASGAGKSSLLRAIAGLEHPTAGTITFGAVPWYDHAAGIDLAAEHRRVGYVPQDYGLFPHLTVAANVAFAGRRPRPDLLQRVGVAHLADTRPGELSGGERQRVALARALAREPQVLLLDEPFAALDTITRSQLRAELAAFLRDIGLPALLVTHSFDDAAALAQRVGVIDTGRLLQLATAAELLDGPADPTVAALTGANIVEGVAARNGAGSRIALSAGGELTSTDAEHGPVRVAIHPWDLRLVAPESATLVDRVVSVRDGPGVLVAQTTRFVIHRPARDPAPPPTPGETVGIAADPARVRTFPAAGGDRSDVPTAPPAPPAPPVPTAPTAPPAPTADRA